jgi:hypothetical protein
MDKIRLIAVFLILLLLFPITVHGVQEAGTSATLSKEKKAVASSVDNDLKRKVITEVLAKYNAPLLTEVDGFMDTCIKYDLDCYLLPSISGVESTFGRFTLQGSHNPFGWGGGLIMFDSWSDGIDAVGKGIRGNYIDKWGAASIEEIGPIYAASPTWAQKVRYFHSEFERVEEEKRLYFSKLEVEL